MRNASTNSGPGISKIKAEISNKKEDQHANGYRPLCRHKSQKLYREL